MERKNDSNNQLNSISLEDENEKKEFTDNLIKPEIKEQKCFKSFVKILCCKIF